VEIPTGRVGGALNGFFQQRNAFVEISRYREAPAELGERIGIVRIDRESPAGKAFALPDMPHVVIDR